MYNITKEEFINLPLPIPSFLEQKTIASILSTWDRAIETLESLIAAKEQRKKELMQRLLTGKVRFGEFVQTEKTRKTRFYDLPADWEYLPIGKLAKELTRRNGGEGAPPVLSCTKHDGLVSSLSYFGKQVFSKDLTSYRVVPRGAFAYATNHIEEGSIGYQDLYDKALISPVYTVFTTTNQIDDGFLFRLLKTEWYRHIFQTLTSASVDRRGSLRWKDFARIKVPVPSLEEQAKINAVLDIADRELAAHREELAALKTQKRGLMRQLLTGKVRVKTPSGNPQ
jgi:type I restriction enzyme S subunit